jgi:hypothetical protein
LLANEIAGFATASAKVARSLADEVINIQCSLVPACLSFRFQFAIYHLFISRKKNVL